LSVITAAGLAAVSLAMMAARSAVLGKEVHAPAGPGAWKVTMLVRGRCLAPDARLLTGLPLNLASQRIQGESFHSAELVSKAPDSRRGDRRQLVWTVRPASAPGTFQVHQEFYAVVEARGGSPATPTYEKSAADPPRVGEHLEACEGDGKAGESLSAAARAIAGTLERPPDQTEALFRFVAERVQTDPSVDGPAVGSAECLRNGSGDSGAKARLLADLLRCRGIPARVVTGLALSKGHEQLAHHWVEAWLHDRWFPMCPVYHYFGHLPGTFLVFALDDLPIARGRQVRDLDYGFVVEKVAEPPADAGASHLRRVFRALSLRGLPAAEQRQVEFLLLLPVAALLVCVFRNVIGLNSFGTFAPALIGLAFRELSSLPGLAAFVSVVLVGWVMRRVLDRFHLLQVPRKAFVLSLVAILLIVAIVATSSRTSVRTSQFVALFPLVILTGMVERFWTLENEDSTAASFRTLAGTMLIAATVGLFLGTPAVLRQLVRYPETLGLVMAGQLLLGRYTGYKVAELLRFRDFLRAGAVLCD
jgi:hypothetical protein